MKIISYVSADQQKANFSGLDDKGKYDKALIEKLLPKFSFHEKRLITTGRIVKNRHSEQMVFFEARVPAKQKGHLEYEGARYWYRTMPREDFIHLGNNGQLIVNRPNDYLGIAPNLGYVSENKYYGNDKPGTHIVEFEMSMTGSEFCDLLYEREKQIKGKKATIQRPKGEGGGTIGLGPGGMYSGLPGLVFNEMLGDHRITWRLVAFRCPNPLPRHEFYY